MDSKEKCRSWFVVLNNPQNDFPYMESTEMCEYVLKQWIDESPTRTGAVAYCISEAGLHHLHMVLEDSNQTRFSALKKAFPHAHLEPTKGTKEQAEDYIHKRGKFEEKGEQVLYIARHGEIKGAQGQRKDFEVIQDLLETGKKPSEIMSLNLGYRRYEDYITGAYFAHQLKIAPLIRDVFVTWLVGESGSGKTYTYVDLCNEYGEDEVYLVSDYGNGMFDKYEGEKIVFFDEFRGQIRYSQLLSLLQGYKKQQIPCRYHNRYGLWEKVYISSVLPPEDVYSIMVPNNQDRDTREQLFRRISCVVYCYKDLGGYHKFELDGRKYTSYEDLKRRAHGKQMEFEFVHGSQFPL